MVGWSLLIWALSCSLQTVSVLAGCEGKAPGYYAEPQSECRTYLLCVKENRAEGLHFNCPPGTKFHQATQVCHHESAVECQSGQSNISDLPDNSVDTSSELDESIRFKREKLTDQLKVSKKKKAKHNASAVDKKIQVIKKKKNKKIKSRSKQFPKLFEKKEVPKKSHKKVDDLTEEVDAELELDRHDEVSGHNCRDRELLCKLSNQEIGENKTVPASEEEKESLARGLVIPTVVNDTTKLMADPATQKPIKSDSDDSQNRVSSPVPKLKLRTKPLDQIPFSRVVAAQKKINGQFSPYISFPDLLTNLTKSQRSVRMIPIAISSSEAKLIRNIIKKNNKQKTKKSSDHPRLPRKIFQTTVTEKQTKKQKPRKEYQIIYKDDKPLNKVETTTEPFLRSTPGNKTDLGTGWRITVKPRGPHRGFFNREKFKQILTSNLRTDKDHNKGEEAEEVRLEFGFSPIKSKEKRTEDKIRKVKQDDVYFDEFLDTLQAPGNTLSNFLSPAKNSKRSPKHFPPPSQHSQTRAFKKQNLDRKSNLDFLGIFDTRKYFFIPPNRRSDDSETQSPGILSNLVKFFRH